MKQKGKEMEELRPSYHKHLEEDYTTDQWKRHKKHFFILSETGRPIFTRYGNENELNPIMSFFMATVALVGQVAQTQQQDTIRTVLAPNMKIVYLLKGALYLVAVSKTTETEMELAKQLEMLYEQILCILTDSIQNLLRKRSTFDLRNLLGGTDAVLYSLIHDMSHTLSFSLKSIKPVVMSKHLRILIGDLLLKNRVPKLMFSLLISGDRLVQLISNKKYTLQMSDLLLLSNFVNSSASMRTMETWTPVCLPALSSSQYVYAYVNFLSLDNTSDTPTSSVQQVSFSDTNVANDLCLVMLCSGQDVFFDCSNARRQIETQLKENESLYSQLKKAIQMQDFPVTKLGVMSESASLRHFFYRSPTLLQYTTSSFTAPYNIPSERKRLIREYKLVRQNLLNLCTKNDNKIYFQKTKHECMLGMSSSSFELIATFSLITSKPSALLLCESIKKWIRREEDSLFIGSFPMFSQ